MFSCGVIGIAFVHVVFNRQLVKHDFSFWGCCQIFSHPRAVLGILTGFSPAALHLTFSGLLIFVVLSARASRLRYVCIIYYRRFGVKVFSLFLPLIPKLTDALVTPLVIDERFDFCFRPVVFRTCSCQILFLTS